MAKTKRKVLITGGAGFIGRCLAFECEQSGLTPIILDDFSTSKPGPHTKRWTTLKANLVSVEETQNVLRSVDDICAVFHLAARALVSESCLKPGIYFRNNLASAITIAEWCVANRVPLIHSSSCAVYGMPEKLPITENAPIMPTHPYGETKALVERIFAQFQLHQGLKTINLRYFNPSGSADNGQLGEEHEPETHLVPNLVRSYLARKPVYVFGSDYPTKDGTCIRDFIHIKDLAQAHIRALHYLENTTGNTVPALNLGTGNGTTIKEMIGAATHVFGYEVPVEMHPRRPGDPAVLIADSSLAYRVLDWKPTQGIEQMISDHRIFEELRSRGSMGK